jgi:hypothetical protein
MRNFFFILLLLIPHTAQADPSWGQLRRAVGDLQDQVGSIEASIGVTTVSGTAGGLLAASGGNKSVWQMECGDDDCCVNWKPSAFVVSVLVGFKIDTPLIAPYSGTVATMHPNSGTALTSEVTYGYLANAPTTDAAILPVPTAVSLTNRTCMSAGRALQIWTTDNNEALGIAFEIEEAQ